MDHHANVRFGSPLAHAAPDDDTDDLGASVENDEDDADEPTGKTTLVLYSHRSTVAAAYLTPPAEGSVLHVMADSHDSLAFDTARLVLDQVDPDVVVVNTGAADELFEVLQAFCNTNDCSLEIRPESDFKYLKAKALLLSIHLPAPSYSSSAQAVSDGRASDAGRDAYGRQLASPTQETREEGEGGDGEDADDGDLVQKEMRMGGMLDFSQQYAVCAAGGLVGYLTKVKARGELRGFDDGGGLRVGGIESFTPKEYMHVSAETLSSLGVFAFESHAYTHSSSPQKQGLSLSTLLSTTATPTGALLLRSWLLRPLYSVAGIRARHDAVDCLVKSGNASVVGALKGGLKGIKNLRRILSARLTRGVAESRDWRALLEFCFKMVQVRDGMQELIGVQRQGLIHKLAGKIDSDLLVQLGQRINETIDWDESSAQNRVCCKSGVDATLDEWKYTYAGLDSLLMHVADRIAPTLPADVVKGLNVTYFPQLGFLLAVELDRPWDEYDEGDDVMEGCEFQFHTDQVTYFKNSQMRDLDAHFGDIHSSIVDREIEIVHKLSEEILKRESDLLATVDACAELDCLIAFAGAAVDWNWKRPDMTDENVLEITKGRHPLLEVVLDTFVPNSTLLHGGHGLPPVRVGDDVPMQNANEPEEQAHDDFDKKNSLMVLTGSNASGKSVYGKTAALITYMAHIGSFVPADTASIGLTDKIFTRLTTKESVSKLQSSFTIDLNQISYALRNCTGRSLLIVDEFGKGTITTDGAGLLAGTIVHLLKRGTECPKTIVMTHFHELFTNQLLADDLPISFASMEVVINDAPDDVPKHGSPITYLYRLAPSLSLESHAAACARSQGIAPEIIERSAEVAAYLSRFEFLPLQNRKLSDDEIQQLSQAERAVRAFLSKNYSKASFGARSTRDIKGELRLMLEVADDAMEDGEEGE